ncbi:MAG: hypothetical protein KJ698_03825 [Actinobacteria bacterium]|nr:hypothetical protein [Actinomycetota bacterium]MBU1493097.1 hypothetical protein [Actinomycetota bacterium]
MRTFERLLEPATFQHGYVTTRDAVEVDVPPVELRKLAHRGRLTNVMHGVYRVNAMPYTKNDELMRAVLWPGRERAVITHQTALLLWELADVSPTKIDIAVRGPHKPRRRGGEKYRVRVLRIDPADVDYVDNIPVVIPEIAIVQAAEAGAPRRFIEQAIRTARKRELFGRETEAAIRDKLGIIG